MKNLLSAFVLAFALPASAALPEVTVGGLVQNPLSKRVTIPYTLTDGGDACIVTVDVKTNGAAGYASIGGGKLTTLWGDVNRKIPSGGGEKTVYWNPASAGFDLALDDVKVEVSVWPTNSPPDFMVLDLSGARQHRFYPEVGQIPLGVTNDVYKTDYLVMRKIPAAGVTWRMGAGTYESPGKSDSTLHLVTLPEDFYLAVYEMTQGQMRRIGLASVMNNWSVFTGRADSDLRPVEGVTWYNIRYHSGWPADGHVYGQYSYFNYLREKTGNILFDLPTESQWEYACRAGTKTKYHNNDNYGIDEVAWYISNCTNALTGAAETHPVGLKAPNRWGLYDMIGNVREWCLDYYKLDYGVDDEDYDDDTFKGPSACDAGLIEGDNVRVLRGGCYKNHSIDAKSAARNWGQAGSGRNSDVGFRLWCPAVYPL